MTLLVDSCRLYAHLRDKAFAPVETGSWSASDSWGVTDLNIAHGEPEEVGLTRQEAQDALHQLCRADLVHYLTPAEADSWQRTHPGPHDHMLSVEPCDGLTAATLVVSMM